MNKIYLLILSSIVVLSANAQWTRTNVDTMDTGIEAMCEHNGSLYASIYNKGLIKYDNASSQWLEVADNLPPTGNSAHIVNMASTGNYLYAYVNDQYHASTTIYRSMDDGITFETDTVGHPRYGSFPAQTAGYPAIVHDVFVLDGRLYNVMGGSGYTKNPADATWVPVTDPNVKFAEGFGKYNSTWYAAYSNKLYTSTDQGVTWVAPANAGLTPGFGFDRMTVNPTTGRIYGSNTANQFTAQKIFYSDNEGASWDSLAINQYTGNSWINGIPQSVQGMIGIGNDISIMLTNNATNSVIDVLKSTDGGLTFAQDTVGLPFDQFGSSAFIDYVYFQNKIWFAPNSADIYVQGNGIADVIEMTELNSNVYPNPVSHSMTVENEYTIQSLTVINMMGEIVANETPNSKLHTINMDAMPSGMYFVKIAANNQTQTVKVFKN